MRTALFILRAQPLHKGHVHAIKHLMKKYKLIVALGSINRNDSKNPFSYSSRKRMLRSVFKNIKIIGAKDFENDEKWKKNLEKRAKFDIVITGNPWVRRCFSDYPVEKPNLCDPEKYDASRIRNLIRKGGKWEHIVPEEVAKIIKSLK